jgi:hypothetical protein
VCHKVASNLPEVSHQLVSLAKDSVAAGGISRGFHVSCWHWPEVSYQYWPRVSYLLGGIDIGFISLAAAAKGFMSAVGIGQKFNICWCY